MIPIWQCNIIMEALQLLREKEMKQSGINDALASLAKKEGFQKAKNALKEYEANEFTKLGKIAASEKMIQEIREGITDDFNKVKRNSL